MEKSTLNNLLTIVLEDNTRTEEEISLLANSLISEGANINYLPFSSIVEDCISKSEYASKEIREAKMSYLKRLIKAGIDVNFKDENGLTALMWASCLGRPDLVNLLLEAGANPNLTSNSLSTAIMGCAYACDNRDEDASRECFVALMKAGADINAKNEKGETLSSLVEGRRCCSCNVGNCRNSDRGLSFMAFLMNGLKK